MITYDMVWAIWHVRVALMVVVHVLGVIGRVVWRHTLQSDCFRVIICKYRALLGKIRVTLFGRGRYLHVVESHVYAAALWGTSDRQASMQRGTSVVNLFPSNEYDVSVRGYYCSTKCVVELKTLKLPL